MGLIVKYTLYKQIDGILMYLSVTKPDITCATNFISIFMKSPKDSHSKIRKIIFRYIASTHTYGLWFTASTK